MCNPVAIAGAVMMAAGTAMNIRAQNQRESDMRSLQRLETERQDELYGKARPLLDQNIAEYERQNAESEMTAAAAKRAGEYDSQAASAPRANETLPGSQQPTSNVVVLDAFRRALGDATARAQQTGEARAKLASFGDYMGQAALENNQRTDQIGMYGSFSQGSANVLPLELQYAATKRRGAATAGNILTAVGGTMLSGAGGGIGTAAAGAGQAASNAAVRNSASSGASTGGAQGSGMWGRLFSGG